jgi:hypothetical protein
MQVRTAEDLRCALHRLSTDAGLYNSLVNNGAARGKAFSCDAVGCIWAATLTEQVLQRYRDWRKQPEKEGMRFQRLLLIQRIEILLRKSLRGLRHGSNYASKQGRWGTGNWGIWK